MDKQRFILAIVLSAAILIGWSLLFPAKTPPPQDNANSNQAPAQQGGSPAASPQATVNNQGKQSATAETDVPTEDTTISREITIKSPLYEVKLDSHGAVATSWIIKRIKDSTKRELHSVGGGDLELIWKNKEGIKLEQREAPLELQIDEKTADDKLINTLLGSRNYRIDVLEGDTGDEVNLKPGEVKHVVLSLDYQNLHVKKTIAFHADSYIADIQVELTRDNQPLTQAKLLLGPSIGDQGVQRYNFYSIAPQGVAAIGDKIDRRNGQAVNESAENKQSSNGFLDWAGVGDTYFAMIAVPPTKDNVNLEYRATKYEHPIEDAQNSKETRYLITAYVPIPVNGSPNNPPTRLYVGPKDHYLLDSASAEISQNIGRSVDLEAMIDYGFLSWMSRPLAVPILWSIKHLYGLTGSYGIAIILFTIVIYSLFFPLKWRSSKAMKKAQKLAPRMKELQEKIKAMKKTDPRLKELQMEQMRLMKEGNPLGGCLPLLIQMPFLFALYRAITISIDFRQAPFLWINDLSAAEPTTIHILPLLMAASMMTLQLITPAPSGDQTQRRLMAIGMPLLMLWMLWNAPAGLLVYWLVGNVVGFGQQFIINRLTKTGDDEQPPPGKKEDVRSTKKLKARVSQA